MHLVDELVEAAGDLAQLVLAVQVDTGVQGQVVGSLAQAALQHRHTAT